MEQNLYSRISSCIVSLGQLTSFKRNKRAVAYFLILNYVQTIYDGLKVFFVVQNSGGPSNDDL